MDDGGLTLLMRDAHRVAAPTPEEGSAATSDAVRPLRPRCWLFGLLLATGVACEPDSTGESATDASPAPPVSSAVHARVDQSLPPVGAPPPAEVDAVSLRALVRIARERATQRWGVRGDASAEPLSGQFGPGDEARRFVTVSGQACWGLVAVGLEPVGALEMALAPNTTGWSGRVAEGAHGPLTVDSGDACLRLEPGRHQLSLRVSQGRGVAGALLVRR